MSSSASRFIVLEGLDGAGTTTQALRLHESFTLAGRDSFLTFEPTAGAIGTFTRELLSAKEPPPQRVLGLLFAADRLAHTADINRQLIEGRDVICDRYVFSSMAYQTLDPSIAAEWVVESNHGCAVPDLTLFIDVPVQTCLERIGARNEDRTIYEREDRLRAILENYRRLTGLYEHHYGKLVTIDGTPSPDDVHAAITAAIED